jgi:hypothetical protein
MRKCDLVGVGIFADSALILMQSAVRARDSFVHSNERGSNAAAHPSYLILMARVVN